MPKLCHGTLLDKGLAVLLIRLAASSMDGFATESQSDIRK